MPFQNFLKCKQNKLDADIAYDKAFSEAVHLIYRIAFDKLGFHENKEINAWGEKVYFLASAKVMAEQCVKTSSKNLYVANNEVRIALYGYKKKKDGTPSARLERIDSITVKSDRFESLCKK